MTHLLELREDVAIPGNYLVAQSLYSGWTRLEIFEIGAVVLAGFLRVRKQNEGVLLLIASGCFIISNPLIFCFIWF
ncbi:MAG TPA: hypothetical protein VIR29_04430 [Anseongella sp.]